MNAGHVTVEVTETVEIRDDNTERRNLYALRDLGCWLAIDDFGAGYASLTYLDKFPFNVVKIDKGYIGRLGLDPSAFSFVADLCELGRRRDLVVVAEGVETQDQLQLLRRAGCTRVQGYLTGRPAPVSAWMGRTTDRDPA